jgi:hypothetical protein
MEINPYKNGVHSFALGLKALHEFLKEQNNEPFLLKEVIMKLHHGLETLLKDSLFKRNPVFLLDEKTTVAKIIKYYEDFNDSNNHYLLDNAHTITPEEAIKRIQKLKIAPTVNEQEFSQLVKSFKELNALRNQLQHFAIKANPDRIVRLLGNLVPRGRKLINACYADVFSPIGSSRSSLIPHIPTGNTRDLYNPVHDITPDLNSFYDQSSAVLDELSSKYDELLNQAIRAFRGSSIPELPIKVSFKSHGNVGCPPYMPDIDCKGWVNESFSVHTNSKDRNFFGERPCPALYEASIHVEQPQIIAHGEHMSMDVRSKLRITIEGSVDIISSKEIIDISGFDEHLQYLSKPEIRIFVEIECEGVGMFNESHYDIRKVESISGVLRAELRSSVFGDESPSIKGAQSISLNKDNTAFTFHSFVDSTRKLKDHHSLELKIEDKAELKF